MEAELKNVEEAILAGVAGKTTAALLHELLEQDSARANAFFRQILEPITLTPVERDGKRFYWASGTAKEAEMLDRLGLGQAVDFSGCGGRI